MLNQAKLGPLKNKIAGKQPGIACSDKKKQSTVTLELTTTATTEANWGPSTIHPNPLDREP